MRISTAWCAWLFGLLVLPAALAETQTEYFVVLLDGKKIGHAVEERTVTPARVVTGNTIKLTISRLGVPVTLTQREVHTETPEGRPLSFEAVQDMSTMRVSSRGRIEGGTLALTTVSMGQAQQQRLPWPQGAVLAEGLRLATVRHGLAAGTRFEVSTFQPSLLRDVVLHVAVGEAREVDLLGRVVRLTEVRSRYDAAGTGEVTSTSYVNGDLRPLKTVMPLMGMRLEMVTCAKDVALAEVDSVDLLDRMLVRSPEPLGNLRRHRAVTYTLKPLPDSPPLVLPTLETQQVTRNADGLLRLTVRPAAPPRRAPLPYAGSDPVARAALGSNAYLQIERPEVRRLATEAVAGATDAVAAARRIEAFVADYIEDKGLSVGYATAAEVCASRQGDCTEHAVLMAALCRAVGIPARVAVGIAYVERFGPYRDVFGGHAWTEAYLGDHWVGFDAAFKGTGRGGYDAGHITLAVGNGEPGDFFGMMGSLGGFEIAAVNLDP